MQYYELNIYHEMKQLDVKETKISELSFLLFPFRVFIEVFEDVEDLYPYIAGEYRKVPGMYLLQNFFFKGGGWVKGPPREYSINSEVFNILLSRRDQTQETSVETQNKTSAQDCL